MAVDHASPIVSAAQASITLSHRVGETSECSVSKLYVIIMIKHPRFIPLNLEEDISPVSEMNYCNKLSNQRHSSPATWCTNYHNHSAKHTA